MTELRLTVSPTEARLERRDGGAWAELARQPFDATGVDAQDVFAGDDPPDPKVLAAGADLLTRLGTGSGAIGQRLADEPPARLWLGLDPTLERYPWELLRTADGIALGVRHEVLHEVSGTATLAAADWPVRVLVWIGSEAGDEAVLGEEELHEIELALDRALAPNGRLRTDVQVRVVTRRPLATLADELGAFQPHVLHFVGHAGVVTTDGGGVAVREPALYAHHDGGLDRWTRSTLMTALSGVAAMPRLVFLNACSSSRPVDGQHPLARAFLATGSVAVVAMNGPIAGEHAVAFSKAFYGALAAGDHVASAARLARHALCVHQSRSPRWWGAPRLYVRGAPEQVLPPIRPTEAVPRLAELLPCVRLLETRWFAERHDTRWVGWKRLEGAGLTVLTGDEQVGKSSIAKLLVERAVLRGDLARYVDLRNLDNLHNNWLSLLRLVRDVGGAPASERGQIDAAWEGRPFARFDAAVAFVTDPARWKGGALPATFEIDAVPPPDRPIGPTDPAAAKRVELVRLFRRDLAALAENRRLLVVIDHVGRRIDPFEFREALHEPLFRDLPDRVHVVLVLERSELDMIYGQRLAPLGIVVEVPDYQGTAIAALVVERLLRSHPAPTTQLATELRKLQAKADAVTDVPLAYAGLLKKIATEGTP